MTLEEMSRVNPRTIDRGTLVQRSDLLLDKNASQQERCRQYMEQIGNPYCYLDGKTVVKLSFANTRRTFTDCIRSYLSGI